MPKNKLNPTKYHVANAALLHELEGVRQLVLNSQKIPISREVSSKTLCLLHVYQGISLTQWGQLAKDNGLEDWIAFPFSQSKQPFLGLLQDTLVDLAYKTEHDPLTNLFNKRAFERSFRNEVERARRSSTSLSLIMLDIDDFKDINDKYGHAAGDNVLLELARILLTETRHYDISARVGGDEFSIILPGAGLLRARTMVDRLLTSIRNCRLFDSSTQQKIRFTCSAGIVTYKGMVDSNPPDLLLLADKALYQAKADGKNGVACAPLQDAVSTMQATLVDSNEKKFLFTGN
ncbi:diguanylate cyclase (GGDEF) domain-containing protein [Desulfobaculum bizertense DSM 18034]|uniref:diguanylate cyclase n=1 Tax=Desulfobaculum bizertense DSM 18034 TaxID=1121442 RepID=A0A1T4W3W3_9BACT|nr:diguanylate cyclase (GGDEF) domain-containing protein [Desulfobaculum bizertense DSM 18034]